MNYLTIITLIPIILCFRSNIIIIHTLYHIAKLLEWNHRQIIIHHKHFLISTENAIALVMGITVNYIYIYIFIYFIYLCNMQKGQILLFGTNSLSFEQFVILL